MNIEREKEGGRGEEWKREVYRAQDNEKEGRSGKNKMERGKDGKRVKVMARWGCEIAGGKTWRSGKGRRKGNRSSDEWSREDDKRRGRAQKLRERRDQKWEETVGGERRRRWGILGYGEGEEGDEGDGARPGGWRWRDGDGARMEGCRVRK